MSGASNAIGVRKIPMHDSLKCVDQVFFPVHSPPYLALRSMWIPSRPQQNPTIHDWCRPKSLGSTQRIESHEKSSAGVRQTVVSSPYIGRGMWGPISTVARSYGRWESKSPSSQFSLAGSRAGIGRCIREGRTIKDSGQPRAHPTERSHHPDGGSLGKSKKRLLEVCAAIGREMRASLSAMDQTRTAKASRSDRSVFSCGSVRTVATPARFDSLHAAPAGSQRAHGTRLVHQARPGGSAPRPRRRGAEMDRSGLAEVPDRGNRRSQASADRRRRFL